MHSDTYIQNNYAVYTLEQVLESHEKILNSIDEEKERMLAQIQKMERNKQQYRERIDKLTFAIQLIKKEQNK